MSTSIDIAVARMEAQGLHVTVRNPTTLFIAAVVDDVAPGFSVSNDATFLIDHGEKWLAIFPARGQCTFELPGGLTELTELVLSVYKDYREKGGRLHEAFMRVVPIHQRYLRGASSPPTFSEAKTA